MKPWRAAAAVASALVLVGAGSASAKHVPGPNLVVNPSFEESVIDAAGPVAAEQPLMPIGWQPEGFSVLHDHTKAAFRTGKRSAIISGALGGGQKICDPSSGSYQCVDNPLHGPMKPVDDEASKRWSIRPFWVTRFAIPVKAETTYRFSVWAQRPSLDPNAGVDGHGAATRVRWLGAGGSTISVVNGPAHLKTAKRDIGWKLITADLVAPKGATGAQLMLGHSDWVTTGGQVAFDDVEFREVTQHP